MYFYYYNNYLLASHYSTLNQLHAEMTFFVNNQLKRPERPGNREQCGIYKDIVSELGFSVSSRIKHATRMVKYSRIWTALHFH